MYRQPAAPPKTRLPLLDRVAIKTPGKAAWSEIHGDDRVRLCCTCSKNVYDLSAMTEDEAEAFLAVAGAAAVCAVAAVAAVVADAHVPRAHGLPRSTSRFEVPRAVPAPPAGLSFDGDEAMHARTDAPLHVWGVEDPSMGGIEIMSTSPRPYGDQGPPRPKVNAPQVRIAATGMTVTPGLPREIISRISVRTPGASGWRTSAG